MQVELDSGKRVKVKAAHVLLRFAQPSPSELLSQARTLSDDIDLNLAWEFAPEGDFGFADLAREADGLAHTYLNAENGAQIDVWQDASFKYVVLFTPDFYPTKSGKVWAAAIEPQTAAANAFNSGEDLLWLEPHVPFSASWGVKVREPRK